MANKWGKMETVTDFILLDSKITVDGDCNHEINLKKKKKKLAPWTKSYDKPRQHIKSRDITLATNICMVKALVSPVVMYRCESWIIKKVECQIIDALELWC